MGEEFPCHWKWAATENTNHKIKVNKISLVTAHFYLCLGMYFNPMLLVYLCNRGLQLQTQTKRLGSTCFCQTRVSNNSPNFCHQVWKGSLQTMRHNIICLKQVRISTLQTLLRRGCGKWVVLCSLEEQLTLHQHACQAQMLPSTLSHYHFPQNVSAKSSALEAHSSWSEAVPSAHKWMGTLSAANCISN